MGKTLLSNELHLGVLFGLRKSKQVQYISFSERMVQKMAAIFDLDL